MFALPHTVDFNKAHEENDNVLLEYEQMLSLLTLRKVRGDLCFFFLFFFCLNLCIPVFRVR
jgi:hypothetical protein